METPSVIILSILEECPNFSNECATIWDVAIASVNEKFYYTNKCHRMSWDEYFEFFRNYFNEN